jgi:hypothetical protein
MTAIAGGVRIAEEAGWGRELLTIEFSSLIKDGFEVKLTRFESQLVGFRQRSAAAGDLTNLGA